MNSFSDDDLRNYLLGKLDDDDRLRLESLLDGSPDLTERLQMIRADDQLTRLVGEATQAGQTEAYAHWTPSDGGSHWSPGDDSDEHLKEDADQSSRREEARPPAWLRSHPRYEIQQLLGVGGMGRVWLARHTVMGRLVALKTMRSGLLTNPHAVERFLREVQAAAKLSHPNIAAAYDAEQIDDVYLLAMEYVPGRTLASVARSVPLSTRDACCAIRDAAAGLAHAHAAGLVHRDIKPGNLIQTPSGVVKILDFGLVVISDSDSSITGDNFVMGTPDYIAPEQAEDPRKADARSDLYSLGCTMYYLLTSRAPFAGVSPVGKIDLHRTGRPARIPGIPNELNGIIDKLMQKDPGRRFQSADEVRQALEPWCRDSTEPFREPQRLMPRQRSRRGWIVAAGGLTVVGVVEALRRGFAPDTGDRTEPVQTPVANATSPTRSQAAGTNTDAKADASATRVVRLEDLVETVEPDSPRDSHVRSGSRMTVTATDGGPQVWLDFIDLSFTDLTLECRMRATLGTPFSFVKFAFLAGEGAEVNLQLMQFPGEPRKLMIAEWDPEETVLVAHEKDESFGAEWSAWTIEIADRRVSLSINNELVMTAEIRRTTSRKLAISAKSATLELDRAVLTCRDPLAH